MNTVIKTVYELEQRFEFKQMHFFGSADAIARKTRGLKNSRQALAWFEMRNHLMGWNKVGLQTYERQIDPRGVAVRRNLQKQRAAGLPEGAAKKAASNVDYDWAVFPTTGGPEYPRFIAIHESGHRFHANFQRESDAAILGWREQGWHLALSEYGATNSFEFVAESFTFYMQGEDQHWRIKPELLTLFKSKDARYAN